MKDLLNITPVEKRITGKIKKVVSAGWYIIEDAQGRRFKVAGHGYKRSQTVAAVGGQIVDLAGTNSEPEVFQV